jgi:putative cardiolipin synthase
MTAGIPYQNPLLGDTMLRSLVATAISAVAILATGCASLPPPEGRTATNAIAGTEGTRLGRAIAPELAAHPDKSGIHPLSLPRDAFAARVALAAAAERSIDVQYYIWHGDQVGYLMFAVLWQAAERGVRVRMLIDDLNTAGLDQTLAALDAHPNIEVRLYNPLTQRSARFLNFLGDFARVNRRMHNKSFTVDNQVSVVGGRNIGNEYFGAGDGMLFADLDVIAIGPVVAAVSGEFDLYWNSPSAYPAADFVGTADADGKAALVEKFAATRADPASADYIESVRTTPIARELVERKLQFEWATAQVVFDSPAKTLDDSERTDILLFPELVRKIGRPEKSFDLITPYFVPGEDGTAALAALAGRGVSVRILTNSLEASDVSAVHAGYAKRRKALLLAGIKLYELKSTAGLSPLEGEGKVGSSASSGLHAKTFAVDRNRVFVGSFNFDQRSALLNTEMGLVIHSATLGGRMAATFDTKVPMDAYEVRFRPGSEELQWIEWTPAGERLHDTEPGAGWWEQFKVKVLSVLPIEWLL